MHSSEAPDTPPSAAGAALPQSPAWLNKRVGRYQLQALLGEGENGRVFRAEDLQLARQVALKIISISPISKSPLHTVDHAIAEARLAASLDHPNIVHVYEVNKNSQMCYIAMELVEGGNLKDLVDDSGPLDFSDGRASWLPRQRRRWPLHMGRG